MNTKLAIDAPDFEQPRRVRPNYFWATPAVLLAIYYVYVLFNGWSVDVVELRPTHCQLVKHFDARYFKYRSEGILEYKSEAASLGANILYAPYPRGAPYGVQVGDEQNVFVPAWAYRCDS